LVLLFFALRPLRTNWLMVGIYELLLFEQKGEPHVRLTISLFLAHKRAYFAERPSHSSVRASYPHKQ